MCIFPRDCQHLAPCDHEEANTQMILHMADVVNDGYQKVTYSELQEFSQISPLLKSVTLYWYTSLLILVFLCQNARLLHQSASLIG